jgi:ankyrin repeat protein
MPLFCRLYLLLLGTLVYTIVGAMVLNAVGLKSGGRLYLASHRGDLKTVRAELHRAPQSSTVQPAARLNLPAWLDPLAETLYTQSALGAAAMRGQTRVVQLLLEADMDVNGGKSEGPLCTIGCESPLYAATIRRYPAVVSALLAGGANVNVGLSVGAFGWLMNSSPMFEAAALGDEEMVRALLAAGAKPDAGSKSFLFGLLYSARPLLHAAMNGHTGAVRLLLAAGASPDAASQGIIGILVGEPPIVIAHKNGRTKVVVALQEALDSMHDSSDGIAARTGSLSAFYCFVGCTTFIIFMQKVAGKWLLVAAALVALSFAPWYDPQRTATRVFYGAHSYLLVLRLYWFGPSILVPPSAKRLQLGVDEWAQLLPSKTMVLIGAPRIV